MAQTWAQMAGQWTAGQDGNSSELSIGNPGLGACLFLSFLHALVWVLWLPETANDTGT